MKASPYNYHGPLIVEIALKEKMSYMVHNSWIWDGGAWLENGRDLIRKWAWKEYGREKGVTLHKDWVEDNEIRVIKAVNYYARNGIITVDNPLNRSRGLTSIRVERIID